MTEDEMKDAESPCPLNNEERNRKGRHNPASSAIAHCYQLHDSVRHVFSMAHVDKAGFDSALDILIMHAQNAKQMGYTRKEGSLTLKTEGIGG